MTLDDMKNEAKKRIEETFPEGTNFRVHKVYENLMDGTLVSIMFDTSTRKEEVAYIHFGSDEIRFHRWNSDVLNAVSSYKERNTFFRLLALTGIGGVIALILVVVFSILLFVLALMNPDNSSIVEVVKLSFTIILGFFFGSQTSHKKKQGRK